jgi:hypothetical protein
MGEAKAKRLSIKDCYLCGKPLMGPVNVDHVPPKLFFPDELRKGLNLLTIPTHVACNEVWRMDEEYFVHTLVPLARGTPSGNAAIRQSLRKYEAGRNLPLISKRPANRAFRLSLTRENVCPLTGKLRGPHDEGYGSFRS